MAAACERFVPRDAASCFSFGGNSRPYQYVELTQCPYDRTPIEAESLSGGSMLLTCPQCAAAVELHRAWLHRVREPDRDAVLIARNERSPEPPRNCAVRQEPVKRGSRRSKNDRIASAVSLVVDINACVVFSASIASAIETAND